MPRDPARSLLPAFGGILGSSAVAQLLLFASTPLLVASHDKDSFGVFGLASIAAIALSTLLSLKLDHSLHLSPEPARLLGSCLQSILVGTLVLALPTLALVYLHGEWIVALTLLFAATHAAWNTTLLQLNLRQRYRAIALQNLLPPIVFVAGALSGDELGGVNALLFWQSVAYLVAALVGGWLIRHDVVFPPLASLPNVVSRHRDDVRYLVPGRLLQLLSSNVHVLGAAYLFGAELAGLVVVANRIARAPVRVLGDGMSNVLRAAIPRADALSRTFVCIGAIAVTTALLATAAVALVPESLYARFFGSDWAGLAPVLLVTTVAAGFQLLAGSVASLLAAYAKRTSFLLNLALVSGGAAAFGLARSAELGLLPYLWLGCALSSAVHLGSFALSLGIVRRRDRHTVPEL